MDTQGKFSTYTSYGCIFGNDTSKTLTLRGFSTFEKSKHSAFTLAEVLITLGIIGVVAAMTMPTLMANVRKAQYSAAFKKGISTLNQAVRSNVANYDFDFGGANEKCANSTKIDNPQNTLSLCAIIGGNLKGVSEAKTYYAVDSFVSKYPDIYSHLEWGSSSNYLRWQLADGTIVGLTEDAYKNGCTKNNMYANSGSTSQYACQGYIDVNGASLPNKPLACEDVDKIRAINADDYQDCTISSKDLGDVVPIFFYDQTVVPATNAARALFNSK
jgi:prepilin-type N-terminal cleavage/methylation domain-containing protein